ncbi:MAG: flagellar hook-associated protein 3 FlgL [Candidatus Latescibacterota bacterium]|jgi:flagellar hook-associated protein 3 FlgL
MRVADNVTSSTVRANLTRSFGRINKYQTQLSSGTMIQNASDDPQGAAKSLILRSNIRNVEQYQRNINDGLGHMDYADSVLNDLVAAVTQVRGLAIQGASDTVNAQDREILAKQVNEVLEFSLGLSHAKFRGEFIFAGTETSEIPYEAVRDAAGSITEVDRTLRHSVGFSDSTTAAGTLLSLPTPPAGNVTIGDQVVAIDLATDSLADIKTKIDAAAPTGVSVTIDESILNRQSVFRLKINGTTTAVDNNNVLARLGIDNIDTTNGIFRAVDDNIKVQLNVPGQAIFEGAQNPFSALIRLRDGLVNDDKEAIRQSITDLEAARSRISDTRGVLGARTNRIELARGLLERFEVELSKTLSNTEDVDLAEAVMNLQAEQGAFQAALISGQTVNMPTLIDFLG